MAYPILAAQNTWFAPNVSTVTRSIITEIEIMDSYTPNSSVTVVDSWDASAAKNGSITCYVIGTKLIIAGNGSGKIALNEDSKQAFSYNSDWSDYFSVLTTINGANLLDLSNTANIKFMFYDCLKLVYIDVSQWNTSNVFDFSGAFYGCKAITNIDVTNWNASNASDINSMFAYCSNLKTLDLSNWNVTNKVNALSQMFYQCKNLESIGDISNWDTSNLVYMRLAFGNCEKLKNLSLGDWGGSKVIKWDNAFVNCLSLESLELKNISFKQGTSLSNMFGGMNKLKKLDISDWDVSGVIDMSFMFYGRSSLGEIDVSNWNTSNVTNLDHFAAHANLKRKGMEKWNTSSLINANAAFHNCAEEELNLSGWDVSKVQFFCQMFENSPNLKRVRGLDKWDTSAGLGFDGMFERCGKLEEVDLSAFDTSKAKNNVKASENNHKTATLSNMFLSCNNLKKVKIGSKFAINGDGTNTTAANKLILPTPSIEGADGNWYDVSGDAYAPNAIQDRTEETYYASYPLVADLNVVVKNGSLIDTARAIREKNGTTNKYEPSEFGDAIRAI